MLDLRQFYFRLVYDLIVSVLTASHLSRIFEQRKNYDLRRLFGGADRLVDNLMGFMDKEAGLFLGCVQAMPLLPTIRDSICDAIIQSCSKIKVSETDNDKCIKS